MAGDVPFEERRPFLLDAARTFLEHHRKVCHEMHNAGGSGREVVACITAMADELILSFTSVRQLTSLPQARSVQQCLRSVVTAVPN